MSDGDSGTGWGVSHLTDLPVTISFGVVLLAAVIVLVLLRYFFADITVRGGTK